MSQPPGPYGPPGQQPSQGGPADDPGVFGAPFEPRPGVYGQPPAGPYGQPTASYGYPQPPAPYGHPHPQPQPTGPGGHGSPNGPTGPNGPRRRSRGRTAGLIAAVLAGVLVIGAGVWFAVGDGAGGEQPLARESTGASTAPKRPSAPPGRTITPAPKPADLNAKRRDGESRVLWVQENTVDLPGRGATQYGPWFAGDIVAKAMYRTVSGYSAADGTQKWSVAVRTRVCAAPTLPSPDGKIVVGLESGTTGEGECDRLQMVDLRTGKAGWSTQFKREGVWDKLSDLTLAVNGDVLTVGRTGSADAYRISDGKHLWDKVPGNCQPYGFTSGSVPLAATSCDTAADDHAVQHVRRIDPATGRELWAYPVKKGFKVDQFYSTDPPVVSLRKGKERWGIVILNTDGSYRSQLVGNAGENYAPRCGKEMRPQNPNLDNCLGVAADTTTFYMAADGGEAGGVVAFDLATGKSRWRVDAPAGQHPLPLRTEGGRVLVYLEATRANGSGRGGGIYALTPAGGALQPVLRHPDSASGVEGPFREATITYSGGRAVLMQEYVSGGDDKQEKAIVAMLAFGD
ncbi:PQQ-binding-like beta-propeller repeat protein [Streptomyces sp. cmx-18-6]|uniref:outer membrane protein assembly factor BamB family protein n=1 Tax=Streptomyces sp. cmx-18-6 TaxID=2790930 RepID=UPI00397F3BBC